MSSYPKSVQPGIPKLAELKPNYRKYTFGDLLTEIKRPVNMLDDSQYRLITVKRSRGGIEERGFLLGKKISVKSQFEIAENDFVISKRQIVHGACDLVSKEYEGAIVSNEYSVLRVNELLDVRYLKYLSHSVYFQQTCFHSSIGIHVEKMIFKLDTWFKWPVNIPVLEEQQKIADFLSSVDKKIEQLTEKHRLLTEYKKGVMQQIFSQQIRFKDDNGNDYPEWEVRTLGSISKRKTAKNKDESINQVLTNSASQGIVSQTDYFDKDIANQNNLGGYYIVDTNDFVYNPRISVSAPVGPIKRNHLGLGVMSPLYTVFEITEGSQTFFERYFDTNLWHRYMNQIANFGARHDRMNITTVDFYKMSLPFPCIEEQQKIASFLTEIDQKINQAWSTLEQTKAFKKGLLQKMFV